MNYNAFIPQVGAIHADDTIRALIKHIGDDYTRPGMRDTPRRVMDSWKELFSGYSFSQKHIEQMMTQFENEERYDEIILLRNIEFYSTCEHHMLPFTGVAHVAYVPNDKIVGLSKLARLLEVYTRRLQIQERIGQQVCNSLVRYLNPKGAACILTAKHLCISCRGVNKQQSEMVTSSLVGCFKEDEKSRMELLTMIRM